MRSAGRRALAARIDSVFARGRKKADVRRIGEERQADYNDAQRSLSGGTPLHECSDTMLALAKLDRDLASDANVRLYTLMDPVLFFYVVAVAEDALEGSPHAILPGGDGPGMHDAGRRARLQARHILLAYFRYARTSMSRHEIGAEFGIGQKAVGRYVKLAKALLAAALPTPRRYEAHIRGLADPREIKRCLPGPGCGACIEDGMLCRMRRPGQKMSRDGSHSGRKRAHVASTVLRFNLRGEAVSMTPTVNGNVPGNAMCRNHPLDLGLATANIGDDGAPFGGRFHRVQDGGFRGTERGEPGAAYERPAAYKALQRMDGAGREGDAEVSRKRLLAERSFGRMMRYRRMAGPYAGTCGELNDDLNIAAGLANLHLMYGDAGSGGAHEKKKAGGRKKGAPAHRRNLDGDKREIEKAAGIQPKKRAGSGAGGARSSWRQGKALRGGGGGGGGDSKSFRARPCAHMRPPHLPFSLSRGRPAGAGACPPLRLECLQLGAVLPPCGLAATCAQKRLVRLQKRAAPP